MIKKIKNFLVKKELPLLKVYSHPRSGTHFLEAFLASNFYEGKDLFTPNVIWGHWSNRLVRQEGNPYGKLFGSHKFPDNKINVGPKVYIVRDGRAVAYSVWKTPNFLHQDISNLSFKEFLRTPIDWFGTPSKQTEVNFTILEHWVQHVKSWQKFSEQDKNTLIIKYKDLINEPYAQYLRIHEKYFSNTKKLNQNDLNVVKKPVGLLPNKAIIDSWKDVYDEDDLNYFYSLTNTLLLNEIKFK